MNITNLVFSVLLFFLLTPSILVRLPKNGNKYTVALVHSLIFGVLFYLSHKLANGLEGLDNMCKLVFRKVSNISDCTDNENGVAAGPDGITIGDEKYNTPICIAKCK